MFLGSFFAFCKKTIFGINFFSITFRQKLIVKFTQIEKDILYKNILSLLIYFQKFLRNRVSKFDYGTDRFGTQTSSGVQLYIQTKFEYVDIIIVFKNIFLIKIYIFRLILNRNQIKIHIFSKNLKTRGFKVTDY